jgi:hypothetical protein
MHYSSGPVKNGENNRPKTKDNGVYGNKGIHAEKPNHWTKPRISMQALFFLEKNRNPEQ